MAPLSSTSPPNSAAIWCRQICAVLRSRQHLFNGLAIVGATAAIHPIRVPFAEAAPALAFGVLVVLMILPRHDRLTRTRGVLLLLAYAAFVGSTLTAGGAIE